jgi:moderate conductance mechanosensitive channel
VSQVLRDLGEELRGDPAYADKILEPIEILGLDRFEDSSVIVRARLKTPPLQQWSVGREFNRRMKRRFDELGIEIPFPHRTLYFGEDKNGTATGVRVVRDEDAPEPAAENGDASPDRVRGTARE